MSLETIISEFAWHVAELKEAAVLVPVDGTWWLQGDSAAPIAFTVR